MRHALETTRLHNRIAFGTFDLDLARRVLLCRGNPVPLGSRAVEVLCELVRANGELVEKDALMARVWPGTIVTDNNLQVQISALRRALASEDGGAAWLKTVAGRGYRFVAPLREAGNSAAAFAPPATSKPADQTVQFVQAPDGVHIAAAATGQGPALLRTGLWMTHLEHEWRTDVWGPLNTRLSERFRLLRYDQRGTGMSDRTVPALGFNTTVSDLEAVAGRCAPGRIALLGISQGASTAIEFAVRHPGRVSCMVLLGGYARGWRKRGDAGLAERGEALQALTRQGWGQQNPAFRQLFTSLGWPDAPRAEMDAINELQRLSASADIAAEIVGLTGDVDVAARLHLVKVPTLVMHSEHDSWVAVSLGRELATGIPGAQFVSLASTSHVVQPGEPAWERCVAGIVEFVGRHATQDRHGIC